MLCDCGVRRQAIESPRRAVCALVIVSSVVNVFDEMTNSVSSAVQPFDGLRKVGTVDIRDEAKGHFAVAVTAAARDTPSRDRDQNRRFQY